MLGTIENIKELLNDKSSYGYNDVTLTRVGITSTGSKIITGVDTEGLSVDDVINGTGIVTDSTITSTGITAIKISSNATATSATAIDLTIEHLEDAAFEAAINSYVEEVQIAEMYPRMGADYLMSIDQSAYYDLIDAKTYAACTMYEKFLVKAEEYFIASYFLKAEGLKEVSNRTAMREYKADGQNITIISGPTGKQFLANEYYRKALELFGKAGYGTMSLEIPVL